MKLIEDIFLGIGRFFAAPGLIKKHGLTYYFLFPIVIWALMTWGIFELISGVVGYVSSITESYFDIEPIVMNEEWGSIRRFWETIKQWFTSGSGAIVSVLLYFLLWLLTAIFIKYVLLVLMSPVLAILSERIEQKLTGNVYPFKIDRLIRDVWRGVLVAMRNLFIELVLIILIWLLSMFIPIIAPITIIVTIVISAYFYGFSMMDYVNERRRLSMKDGARFVRQNMGIAIAIGFFIAIGINIPVFGFIIASIASLLGVVAAVSAIHEKIDLTTNEYALREQENADQESSLHHEKDTTPTDA